MQPPFLGGPLRSRPSLPATDAAPPSARAPANSAKAVVRPFADSDAPQVLALYADVFGRQAPLDFEARWLWSQARELHPEASRQWVLAVGGRVVGYLAAIPQTYAIAGESLVAHTPSDYMVHPEFRFHGVRLMQACLGACPRIVSCDDMEATIHVERWLGAAPAGWLTRHVKVLDPRALGGARRWARPPGPIARAVARALQAADAAWWSTAPRGARDTGSRLRRAVRRARR
ncbi:MAG: GNAT family N-acetyltransferase [SAR202 cluster bacterium]|nr:GNAT family N-acetyltransferase [SAR202 cluster bacterium]